MKVGQKTVQDGVGRGRKKGTTQSKVTLRKLGRRRDVVKGGGV